MNRFINIGMLKAAWPICFGYIPLGLACGILAQKVGVSPVELAVMSTMVFAGSGQFIALAMIGSGSGIISIILTIMIVNLRHIFYGTMLNKYIAERGMLYKLLFAQEIVDETSAVNMTMFQREDEEWTTDQAIAQSYTSHMAWITATVMGDILGEAVYIDTALVSYTLVAMFIGLWSFHFKNSWLVLAGVGSGVLALVLSPWLTNMLNVVVATLVVSTLAAAVTGEEEKE